MWKKSCIFSYIDEIKLKLYKMEEHVEWTAFDKFKTYQKNCDGIKKEIDDLNKAMNLIHIESNKFIYEWVKKHHPSWLKYSTIKYDIENNNEPNYEDDISANIHENLGEIWIYITEYNPKASKLASQGYEVDDLCWHTHRVKIENFK